MIENKKIALNVRAWKHLGTSTAHFCYDIICVLGAAAPAPPPPPGLAGVICCWRKSRSWRGSPSVRRATCMVNGSGIGDFG